MNISRRKFLGKTSQLSAATMLGGGLAFESLAAYSKAFGKADNDSPPNILFLMVDQMQVPPEGYGENDGPAKGLKEIFGFNPLSDDNSFTRFFPGLLRLRQNAVVMRKHYTGSAASVPSRASIMTGQYPVTTGVNQTDGLFKPTHKVPWLDPDGLPTIGDWFRAAGYSTHYFGKWHVSETAAPDYLEPWGFSDWESSFPDAHAGPADNAGAFRDVELAGKVEEFLLKVGQNTPDKPWLAVGSLLNPHDCSIWPINWHAPQNRGVVPWANYPPPPPIPAQGAMSRPGGVGTPHSVELNPDGFKQDNSTLPPTYYESLDNKPGCQKDYRLKWGLSFSANIDYTLGPTAGITSPQPFQLQGENAEDWSLAYNQFYFYCHYLADLQLRRILNALDVNKLTNNTIIVFVSDHGELAGAHGGMVQKWYNAYEETIRVPFVISSPLINADKEVMREITQPTSSVDLLPTVLAMAGIDLVALKEKMENFHGNSVVKSFAGADLSSQINGNVGDPIIGADGNPRKGVLFMTSDTINDLCDEPDEVTLAKFNLFTQYVQRKIDEGHSLAPNSVRQPNHLSAYCTGDWKIVRYYDPLENEPDEWELYCQTSDPLEVNNLVDYRTGEIRQDAIVPGMTFDELKAKHLDMKAELFRQENLATHVEKPLVQDNSLQLFPNYPNPFREHTTIPFYIHETGRVHLSIIGMSGGETIVLVDETVQTGMHQVFFNAADLPPGTYAVILRSASNQVIRKMTHMK